MKVLRIRELSAGYGSRDVLDEINIDIHAGEFVGILGPNGSGKTTLLRTITGLIPVKRGSIELFGQDLESLNEIETAKRVAVVPQRVNIEFPIDGFHVVLMGRYPHRQSGFLRGYSKEDCRVADEAMKRTRTTHLKKALANRLSGGEAKLLSISRAIAQSPGLLLLDEATANLDPMRKVHMFRLFESMNRVDGLTIICVMHDLNLAALFCSRFIFLKQGRVVLDGGPEEVFTPENLQSIYDVDVSIIRHPVKKRPQVLFG
ncbi:Vitamin B12 ABC transporter, ATPase component BtuD [Dissulfuribacter thermophilus]|uniref:Vitamin B12 ABC transporter, ATPase component BtuD n=1 Tax=Dissulfuribacter thermophilus TaxID=1156395 RepID=A0A1B9F4W2_9BACT|nr:ABC transporter ATP-binding protein [Dissulfuribacter thermophilus]OCC14970.1 Vitamin B12 ABC transporter, ATPase component BtuD [Dissulfuribacter thermophilus]